jgi:hypothetical protein
MKRRILFFFAFLLTLSAAVAYDVTAQDKAFFGELRTAVLADDRERLAALVQYPISVRLSGKEVTLATPREFTERYREIITNDVKGAVKQQSADKLQKNWQGVMIGKGEIWFGRIKPAGAPQFVHKVIAVNP